MSISERLGRARAWLQGGTGGAPQREEPKRLSALMGSIEYDLARLNRDLSAVRLDPAKRSARLTPLPILARGGARFAAPDVEPTPGEAS